MIGQWNPKCSNLIKWLVPRFYKFILTYFDNLINSSCSKSPNSHHIKDFEQARFLTCHCLKCFSRISSNTSKCWYVFTIILVPTPIIFLRILVIMCFADTYDYHGFLFLKFNDNGCKLQKICGSCFLCLFFLVLLIKRRNN